MTNYNPEFIKRLALGDETAYEQIKGLSTIEKISIGNAVDTLKRTENIVTPPSKEMSIYADGTSKNRAVDYDGIAKAMADRAKAEKDAEAHKEKIRADQLEKEVRYKVGRSRAGLTY